MRKIDQITTENFDQSFDIVDILTGSVFYPASGTDGYAIECLSNKSNSFVHVDYSFQREVVEKAMAYDFQKLGYKTIGLKFIAKDKLTPDGFRPSSFVLNEYEKNRLEKNFISEKFYAKDFSPFALWAVYELDASLTGSTEGKVERFSLLHIGEEACATFDAIYLKKKINPLGVVILYAGEGYGDNWTLFTDPAFRFYQSLELNYQQNGALMPQYLLTHHSANILWQNYYYKDRYCFIDSSDSRPTDIRLDLFERKE